MKMAGGDTGYIASSNSGSKRGHQGIKWADITLTLSPPPSPEHAKTIPEMTQRHASQSNHQIEAGAEDKCQHKKIFAPNQAIQCFYQVGNSFHIQDLL